MFELDSALTLAALVEDHQYYGNKNITKTGEKIQEFPTKILFLRTYECIDHVEETRNALWKILLDCSRLSPISSEIANSVISDNIKPLSAVILKTARTVTKTSGIGKKQKTE